MDFPERAGETVLDEITGGDDIPCQDTCVPLESGD
jgi:hypothetical protein